MTAAMQDSPPADHSQASSRGRAVDDWRADLRHRLSRAAESHLAVLDPVNDLDGSRSWRGDGAASMTQWLAAAHGLAHRTAAGWVRVAGLLPILPALRAAYASGDLSWDQLRVATRLRALQPIPRQPMKHRRSQFPRGTDVPAGSATLRLPHPRGAANPLSALVVRPRLSYLALRGSAAGRRRCCGRQGPGTAHLRCSPGPGVPGLRSRRQGGVANRDREAVSAGGPLLRRQGPVRRRRRPAALTLGRVRRRDRRPPMSAGPVPSRRGISRRPKA